MIEAPLLSVDGMEKSKITLPDAWFGQKAKLNLISEAVMASWTNSHIGTHSTKTRAAVSGGGRKPWRQKGTGRARQGSIRSIQWRGGGIAHGPIPHKPTWDMPKKMRRQALISALSDKATQNVIKVIEKMPSQDKKKSLVKDGVNFINKIFPEGKVLIVVDKQEPIISKTFRNVPQIKLSLASYLSVNDILKYKNMLFTLQAIEVLNQKMEKTK